MKRPPLTTDRLRLASIEITQRCNNRCFYCDQPKSDRDMSVPRFVELLDALVREGVEAVALGGGEPALHPALPALLTAVRQLGLRAGLTTNACDPGLVIALAEAELLESFGVSAGKGEWTVLVAHSRATVNLLLLRGGLAEITSQATKAVQQGARRLLLLGYKGDRPEFAPSTTELAHAFSLLTLLGRRAGLVVAADDYTRRRLDLTQTCGQDFVRISLDGDRDQCCFPTCEYRT
ncbi:MAG: radical SAM protein [bacterium]|nr:radical SAM protein [bacterium]